MTACDTTTMIRMGDPWAGLDDFHRAALDFIAEIEKQETSSAGPNFSGRSPMSAALLESVSSRLAAAANRHGRHGRRTVGRRTA